MNTTIPTATTHSPIPTAQHSPYASRSVSGHEAVDSRRGRTTAVGGAGAVLI